MAESGLSSQPEEDGQSMSESSESGEAEENIRSTPAQNKDSDRPTSSDLNPEKESEHEPTRLEIDALRATRSVTSYADQENTPDDSEQEDAAVGQQQLQTTSKRQGANARPFWLHRLRFLLFRSKKAEDEEQSTDTGPNT